MKPKSLSDKIEDEINKPRLSNYSLEQLVEKVIDSEVMNSLFRKLQHHESYKRLLFLHKNDLFKSRTEVPIPYLWICNDPTKGSKKKIANQKVSRALTHILSENDPENKEDQYKTILKKVLKLNEEAVNDIKDIIAYYSIDFIRNNPDIKQLANADTFSYIKMKETLGNYDCIKLPSWVTGEESATPIDSIITGKIERLILPVVRGIMSEIDTSMEAVSSIAPPVVLSLHKITTSWVESILRKTGLEYEDYLDVLDDLYRYKVIENKNALTWCEACSVDALQYSELHGAIAPSKLPKDKCINCGSKKSFSAIYGINAILKDAIFSKDGNLAVYFCWLLKKRNIEFDVNKSISQYEADFIIKKKVLVETKVYKAEKDSEAIQSELDKVVKQLEKHIKQSREKGIEIKNAVLLWNRYKMDDESIAKAKDKFSSLVDNCKFSVITPLQMEQFVDKL